MVHQEGHCELESRIDKQVQEVNETDATQSSAFVAPHAANGSESRRLKFHNYFLIKKTPK